MLSIVLLVASVGAVASADRLITKATSCDIQNPVYSPLAMCTAQYAKIEDKPLVLADLTDYYARENDSSGLINGLLDRLLGPQGPTPLQFSPECKCNLLACAKHVNEAQNDCNENGSTALCERAIKECSAFANPLDNDFYFTEFIYCCSGVVDDR